ncbi:MAG: hypothetical protein LBN11_06805, partial [Tannerella sp.]|nr:hypothetical protein [Tannerella sp.]
LSQVAPEKGDTLKQSGVLTGPVITGRGAFVYLIDGQESSVEAVEELYRQHPDDIGGSGCIFGEGKYGDRAKDGVVFVETRTYYAARQQEKQAAKASAADTPDTPGKPLLYFMNGEESTWEEVEKQNKKGPFTKLIYYYGDDAVKRYGEKGRDGVIEVSTEKPAKEEK